LAVEGAKPKMGEWVMPTTPLYENKICRRNKERKTNVSQCLLKRKKLQQMTKTGNHYTR